MSWLFHHASKADILPTEETFQLRAASSINVKQKFALLKDLSSNSFHDLTVQIVRDPYEHGDKMTLWASDYTENAAFFNHSFTEGGAHRRDDDPYGYTSKYSTGTGQSDWPGPFGRMSMQITCYEPHASIIRHEVRAGSWVFLYNVQIKFGTNGNNLEGYLREDRNAFQPKIQVDVADVRDKENIDKRIIDALARKREYEKVMKKQVKEHKAEAVGQKRKAPPEEEPPKQNAKSRRNKKRKSLQEKNQKIVKIDEKEEVKDEEVLGLNERSKAPRPVPSERSSCH